MTACEMCGGELPPRRRGPGRPRRFCDACQRKHKAQYMREYSQRAEMKVNMRSYHVALYRRERAKRLAARKCAECGEPIPLTVHGRTKRCDACHVRVKRKRRRHTEHGQYKSRPQWSSWQRDGLTGHACDECGLPLCRYRKLGRMCAECAAVLYRESIRRFNARKRAERRSAIR